MWRLHGTPELTETDLWIGRGRNDAGGERDGGTAAADVCAAGPGCAAQRHRGTRGGVAARCRSSQTRTSALGPSLAPAPLAPASLGMASSPLASSLVSRLTFAQGGHRLVPTLRRRHKLALRGRSHFLKEAITSSKRRATARQIRRSASTLCAVGVCYSLSPNSAANRFSPVRLKLTTRLPGVASRAAHFSSVNRAIIAAPSVPAR
jgi:hypothetical protein